MQQGIHDGKWGYGCRDALVDCLQGQKPRKRKVTFADEVVEDVGVGEDSGQMSESKKQLSASYVAVNGGYPNTSALTMSPERSRVETVQVSESLSRKPDPFSRLEENGIRERAAEQAMKMLERKKR